MPLLARLGAARLGAAMERPAGMAAPGGGLGRPVPRGGAGQGRAGGGGEREEGGRRHRRLGEKLNFFLGGWEWGGKEGAGSEPGSRTNSSRCLGEYCFLVVPLVGTGGPIALSHPFRKGGGKVQH